MNKVELIAAVTEKTGMSKKDAEKAVSAVLESVVEAVSSGDKVQLVGFGTFEVRNREARTGRNPRFQAACFQGRQVLQGRGGEVILPSLAESFTQEPSAGRLL